MTENNGSTLLFSVDGIKAFILQDGQETSLNASGPQTLSLFMIHSPSNSSTLGTTAGSSLFTESSDQDFCLHLQLPPELDLPLPATSRIFPQPPQNYIIPRTDVKDSGSFFRIEFPVTVNQEDRDTFETILAQCTAFMENVTPPAPGKSLPIHDPQDFTQGGRFVPRNKHGQVVLVDEENGSVLGELAEGAVVVEDPSLQHGNKDPVEIQISQDGKRVEVRPISEDYLELSRLPPYQQSSMVQRAAAASRFIVTGSTQLSNLMTQSADNFVQKTRPNNKPMDFKPATHDRARKIHSLTSGAAGLSAKAVDQVSKYAQNLGAGIARKGETDPKHVKSKPGFLNKSLIAFTTLADGIASSGKTLLESGGNAASTMVGHRYGEQAGSIAGQLAGGVKNVGLVYIDVTGVSRRAVVKSVAKGMVVGRMKDGKQVLVGGGDGGYVSSEEIKAAQSADKKANFAGPSSSIQGENVAPPPYTEEYGKVNTYPTEKRP